MASTIVDAGKNVMINALGAVALYMSLHTSADPTTGANEVTGGTPAYARKAVTWGTASGGVITMNGTDPVFDVPASTIYAVGVWSAATAGTFYGYYNLPSAETFSAQGTFTVTDAAINLNK